MAIDQYRLGVALLVVVGQVVDHEGGAVVGGHRRRTEHLGSFRPAQVRSARAVHVLRRHVPLEDVLEIRGQRTVNIKEVRHIHDVVDDFAAVAVHDGGVPVPIGPLVTRGALDARDRDFRWRRVALGVIPHEQHPVLSQGGPGCRPGQFGCAPAVGHLLAPPVATPAPVVERTRDLVALDLPPREVTAHMPAEGVEHVDVAVCAAKYHKFLPEGVDRVRLAVSEISGQGSASRGRTVPARPALV
jgi:hypothetical protein